jgi:hypothetical protein
MLTHINNNCVKVINKPCVERNMSVGGKHYSGVYDANLQYSYNDILIYG